ncbi:hypothetical protein [Desulfosporosinus sp. BICA1-9]|uniref:hypothetical protein n=1 Tax=Desulfosporosinus sp. BICA1-9 TaxID=1531958 RepID=UPI000A82BA9F
MPRLDLAIFTGIVLSIVLYLKDTNQVTVKLLVPENGKDSQIIEREVKSVNEKLDILIIQLEGNLFFGSADDLQIKLLDIVDKSKIFILRMKYVTRWILLLLVL